MFKKISIIVTVLLILVLGSYYNAVKINTKQIKIREESIISDKIDEDLDGMLIAYFSDLNYGEFVDSQFLNKTIENIKRSTRLPIIIKRICHHCIIQSTF